jgi:hypothetical protein
MTARAHLPLLALCLLSTAATGCGSTLRPRPLSAAQASLVDRIGTLGVVAVADVPCSLGNEAILRAMLERTGLFRAVVASRPAAPAPDYVATITGRCSSRRGGWIPLLPLLTFGVVPQFSRMELGYAFTLRQRSTGREIAIPCEIETTIGVGWLPALMNVLPGWSLKDPEKTRNFDRRLAYAIAARTAM